MNDDHTDKKKKYLEYFGELPVQKLAAANIGVDEDTLIRWRKEDTVFADQIEYLKAQWALKKTKTIKSEEWLLERIMNDHFGEKKRVDSDLTSKGEKIMISDEQLKRIVEG